MRSLLPVTLVVALVASSGLTLRVGAQVVNGTVSGVVSGPSGPLGGVTVNVVDRAGTVVATTVTSSEGAYSVGKLPVGTYTIQVVDNAGKVLGTGTGIVAANVPAVTVNIVLTSSQLAGAAIAAGSTQGGFGTAKVLAIGAAAGAGVFVIHAVTDSSSNH